MICTDTIPKRTFGDNGQYSQPAIVVQTHFYTSTTSEEAEANAALIVKAVNEYDALKVTEAQWHKAEREIESLRNEVEALNAVAEAAKNYMKSPESDVETFAALMDSLAALKALRKEAK